MIGVVRTRAELRAALDATGPEIGLVPTMGALHAGHAALIRRAAAENRGTVVSLFVNPAQFDDPADLTRYPRPLDADLALAEECGATLAFVPPVAEVYPDGFATAVAVAGMTERWEGASRPGHFRGVATVVAILLTLVRPPRAYFGEKDFQQLAVITRMHADLGMPGEIVGCPTVREADGLALSSRNRRLSPEQRRIAPALYAGLAAMDAAVRAGERDVARLMAIGSGVVGDAGGVDLEYLAVVDPATLEPHARVPETGARALVAAKVGSVRLIDNVALTATVLRGATAG